MKKKGCFYSVAFTLFLLPVILSAQWVLNGVSICTTTNEQWYPAIISDGAGGAIITWEDYRNGLTNSDIYAQRVNATGNRLWTTNGITICTALDYQWEPASAPDGSGGAIITWEDNRLGSSRVFAQRVNATGSVQWTVNGIAVCTQYSQSPAIVSDGSGGAIIAWYDWRNGNADIYVQRISATGSPQWTTNGVAVCTALGDQRNPRIISDGSGGAIIVWEDLRNGSANIDIYVRRINSAGVPQWTANGVLICDADSNQTVNGLVSDGAGGTIIVWEDRRDGNLNEDIYAQRINATGVVQWTANGIPICTVTGNQGYAVITTDGAGGAIITWANETALKIFAQRINGSGIVQWTINGVVICNELSTSPAIVSDGTGGAVISWQDDRSSTTDIYVQRVNGSGVAQWTTNGVALCTAVNTQLHVAMTTDGASGAITVWEDERNGIYNEDIYAQRVRSNGSWGIEIGKEPAPISSECLLNSYPNPAHGKTIFNYQLLNATRVSLEIYNCAGQLVKAFALGEQQAGYYQIEWKDQKVTSGVYLYRFMTDKYQVTKKLLLIN